MGKIETVAESPPISETTPHQEAVSPVGPKPPEPIGRISVEEAVRRWLDGQDDNRLPSFEDIQTEIGQLKLRPEERKLVQAVVTLREKIETLP